MLRLFVAIELPKTLKEELGKFTEQSSKEVSGAKWVEPKNLHISLKFLGNFPEENLPKLLTKIEEATWRIKPFNLRLSKAGAFPTERKARVFWMGTEGSESELEKLHKSIDKNMEKLGFERENRKFHSHITLARFRTPQNIESLISKFDFKASGDEVFEVKEIVLFKSELTPRGSIYTILKNFPLKG
ncbi:MAG: RNA 2',3'-cyclic phosphodiesterase [Candidatus Subteraquimicrobiales bacterium]|nr:RNA 2',3'-cyclic phosphodiesterase [Candidatus Subteraquimicrobiales bacterium]